MERLVYCNLSMNVTNAPGVLLITPQALYFFFGPMKVTSGGAVVAGMLGSWVGSSIEKSMQRHKTNKSLSPMCEESDFARFSPEIQEKVKDVTGYRKFEKGNIVSIKRGWMGFNFKTGDGKKISLLPLMKKDTFQEYLLENGYHLSFT